MSGGSSSEGSLTAEDVTEVFERWYHVLGLAVVMGFMIGTRIVNLDRFSSSEEVVFEGVDPFYHFRTTEWTVENFPFTMPYEIFTGFPSGRYVGQFGTLFDQLIAIFAFVIGLGSPGTDDIRLAAYLGVPIMAALVAIPVYLIGKRLSGRLPALVGAAVVALSPSEFLRRSTVGFFDHHVAEVLFMGIAVLALMAALRVGEQEKPVWELIVDRDWEALRRPTVYAVLAGLSFTLSMWAWPSSVFLVGIVGIFFIIALSIEHVRGTPTEYAAFVGAVAMGTTAITLLPLLDQYTVSGSSTSFTFMQVLMALAVAVGCVFMAGLSRVWGQYELGRLSYPAGVTVLVAVGLGVMWLVFPEVVNSGVDNLTRRMIPIDPAVTDRTIQEARPPDDPADFMFDQFGFAFYTMLLGLSVLIARPFAGGRYRVEHLLVIVWTLFLVSMALTQVRFSYYLVLPVGALNAVLVGAALRWIELPKLDRVRDIRAFQLLSVFVIVMVLFVPLLPPVASVTALDYGEAANPSGDGVIWGEANAYLADNTPLPGDWGEHDNSDQVDYHGTYEDPGSAGYDYPDGSYGVMSWWDYGHLITTQAQRMPHANPFQQNARSAATYLTAGSEERAELVLDAIAARGDGVSNVDNETLQQIIDDNGGVDPAEEQRYVMIDDQMAGGKFAAKTQWTGEGFGAYTTQERYAFEGQNQTVTTVNDAYRDSMVNRLYREDANGLDHYRLVHETEQFSIVGGMSRGEELRVLDSLRLQPGWEQLAGVDQLLRQEAGAGNISEIQGLEGYAFYDAGVFASVKTFERVEGATLSGTVEDVNNTVVARATLETNANRTFTYQRLVEPDDDGDWSVTVPYATTNDLGPEDGYTDTDVVANGTYEVLSTEQPGLIDFGVTPDERAEVEVPEEAVYEGEEVGVDFVRPATFEIDDIDAPENATVNESFEVGATITNTGEEEDTQDVGLFAGEQEIDRYENLTLEPDESDTVTLSGTLTEPGEVDLAVQTLAGTETVTITVEADEGG
ncbi:MAG: oligosaccharyl transferase, archaeosortase A system-associated [Halobacteriales archaeon]